MATNIFKAYIIQVFGKVQGVYYRQSTLEKALELGVTGNVQNLLDGSVLIHVQGEEDKVNQLISWCYRGPIKAKVSDVKITPTAFKNLSTFEIIR
jgi:acylphosphatase